MHQKKDTVYKFISQFFLLNNHPDSSLYAPRDGLHLNVAGTSLLRKTFINIIKHVSVNQMFISYINCFSYKCIHFYHVGVAFTYWNLFSSFQGVDTQNTVLFSCQSLFQVYIYLEQIVFPFITLQERNDFVDQRRIYFQ